MKKISFLIRRDTDFIPLIALLKATGVADSGTDAQLMVSNGLVSRNGQPESRKRAKIVAGDTVRINDTEILVGQEAAGTPSAQ